MPPSPASGSSSPAILEGEPHVRRIADACIARFGEEAVWQRLIATISAGSERRRDWGELERSDKTILSLSLAPLPDGATLVTFADVTDRFRIESALRDRNEALVAADRLKSDFIHHASFLFRDPLNAVHGFADMLASGHAGPLNGQTAGICATTSSRRRTSSPRSPATFSIWR